MNKKLCTATRPQHVLLLAHKSASPSKRHRHSSGSVFQTVVIDCRGGCLTNVSRRASSSPALRLTAPKFLNKCNVQHANKQPGSWGIQTKALRDIWWFTVCKVRLWINISRFSKTKPHFFSFPAWRKSKDSSCAGRTERHDLKHTVKTMKLFLRVELKQRWA